MSAFDKAWLLLKSKKPTPVKEAEGSMRRVEIPDEGDAIKYAHPYRTTKLGQLPVNMAISQALEKLGYPVVGEKPYGYRGDAGYTVSQPQANKLLSEVEPNYLAVRRADDVLASHLSSPLINLLASSRGDLDIHPGNFGYFGDELKILDPMYAAEREGDKGRPAKFNQAIRDMYKIMFSNFKEGENTALDPAAKEAWKERLRQVREASDELPEFIQHYKNQDIFRPWLDDKYDFESKEDDYVEGPWGLIQRDRDENVDPRHRQQMLEAFGKYRNFGDALAWLQNTINNPEQSRLYDFEPDQQYKRWVEFMQQAAESERGPESFFPAQ